MAGCFRVEVPVEFKDEGGKVVAYVPGLDIATCGDSLEDAKRMFKEFIEIYFDELLEMGTAEKVLSECGWRKTVAGDGMERWTAPRILERMVEDVKVPC